MCQLLEVCPRKTALPSRNQQQLNRFSILSNFFFFFFYKKKLSVSIIKKGICIENAIFSIWIFQALNL